jgi:hypothetical protein
MRMSQIQKKKPFYGIVHFKMAPATNSGHE